MSMDIDPGVSRNSLVLGRCATEYQKRFRLSEVNRDRGLPVVAWPSQTDNRDPAYTMVRMDEFGAFARRMRWKLPAQFPVDPIDWEKWGRLDSAQVWETILVALGRSPEGWDFENLEDTFDDTYRSFLAVVRSCLGGSLPIHRHPDPDSLVPLSSQERTVVLLPKFREWAEGKGYALPNRFPRAKASADSPTPTAPTTAPPPAGPDWQHWGQRISVHLAEAVLLSLDVEPLGIDYETYRNEEYTKRKLVADDHWIRGKLPRAEGDQGNPPSNHFRYVNLAEFAKWAERLSPPWNLPVGFPKLSQEKQVESAETAPGITTSQQHEPSNSSVEDKPELTKGARESLLTILAAAIGDEKLTKPSSEAGKIERKLGLLGIDKPKKRMIENYLKDAKTLLDNRRKKP